MRVCFKSSLAISHKEIGLKFEEVLEKRRSIRKYKGTTVPKEKILKILEAARIAPSAGHRQPWHFVVVENRETIKKLAKREWACPTLLLSRLTHPQGVSPRPNGILKKDRNPCFELSLLVYLGRA